MGKMPFDTLNLGCDTIKSLRLKWQLIYFMVIGILRLYKYLICFTMRIIIYIYEVLLPPLFRDLIDFEK